MQKSYIDGVTEEMIETAKDICKRYNQIKEDGAKAKIEWHGYEQAVDESVYEKERAMYEALAENASAKFLAAYRWCRLVSATLDQVEPAKARMVLRQHYIEGSPLKSIVGEFGRAIGRTTASYYKKLGLSVMAEKLEPIMEQLAQQEKIIYEK